MKKSILTLSPSMICSKGTGTPRNEEIKIVEAEKDSVSMPRLVVSVLGRALLRVVVPLGDAAEELFYGIKDGLDERETAKENEKIKSVAKNFDEENPTILIRKLKETFEECYNAGIKKVEQPLLFFIDVFEDYNVSPEWLLTGKKYQGIWVWLISQFGKHTMGN